MFKLLDYLDKLEVLEERNTEVCVVCPSCNGKLKIKRSNSAYLCVTENCPTESIRSKLKELGIRATNNTANYVSSSVITPIVFSKPPTFITVDNYQLTQPTITTKDRIVTKYQYNKECLVERVDYTDGRKKQLFPKYKDNGVYKLGSSKKFGLFNDGYVRDKKGTILIAEGEKTADIVTASTGILCLSPPGFGWNKEYLLPIFIKYLVNITGIVFLPDNDKPGKEKAEIIQKASWLAQLPCYIVPLASKFDMEEGEDAADLIHRKVNLNAVLEELCQTHISYF